MLLCIIGSLWISRFGLMKAQPLTRVSLYLLAATGQLYNLWLVMRPHDVEMSSMYYLCFNLMWCIVGGIGFGFRIPTLWADVIITIVLCIYIFLSGIFLP